MQEVKNRIHIGDAEFLIADADMPLTMDATFVPLKNPDGSFRFLTTDLGEKPYYHKFYGTPENPFGTHGCFHIDYNGHCDLWPSGLWVMSAYKCEDGMLIGFCHRELLSRTDPFFCNYFLTGLAVSYDNGDNWKYLGDVLSNPFNGSHKEVGNMGGCPLYVHDGYFHIYFNDHTKDGTMWISGARMKIDETIAAVREGKLPTVFKYSGNGVWATDPIEGTGAPILPDIGFGVDSHGKGAYCKVLDRFLMLVQSGRNGKLVMFLSKDGEHFDEHVIIDEIEQNTFMQPYAFFISTDGDCSDDMNTIGREFYIYYPHKSLTNYPYDEYFRRKITIE